MNYDEKKAFAAEVAKALAVANSVENIHRLIPGHRDLGMTLVTIVNYAATVARAQALGIDPAEIMMTPEEIKRDRAEKQLMIASLRLVRNSEPVVTA